MKEESIAFLNKNRHYYEQWVRAQFLQHLDIATRQGLLDVIRAEFNPAYLSNLWCSPCVAELLVYAYTQYDKYLKKQQDDKGTKENN